MIPNVPVWLALWLGPFFCIAFLLINRASLREWRKSLRRERLLVLTLATFQARDQGELEPEAAVHHINRLIVALADEVHAQETVKPWQRIPPLDRPWPSSTEPAPIVTEPDE